MRHIQFILFLVINNLFIAKYCSRVTSYYPLCMLAYTIFATLVYLFYKKKSAYIEQKNYAKPMYFSLIAASIIAMFGLLLYINPYSVQVDRWSAIHNFLQNLFDGIYPYAARTHLGGYGSPFPVWQVFHIPFFLMGDVGYAMPFIFLTLAITLVWLTKSYSQAFIYMLFLLISPSFWYEVAVRSDLFYNMILCFISITILYKKQIKLSQYPIALGILCGLFLSTRVPIVVPFAIYLFPEFLNLKLKAKLSFVFTAIISFALSFVPFVFWDKEMLFFFQYNPFILQTRQGSPLEMILIAALGLWLATKWKEKMKKNFAFVSCCLLLLVTTTFLHRMISSDFANSLFSVSYDITYFNMAMPFIIYVISRTKIIKNSSSES